MSIEPTEEMITAFGKAWQAADAAAGTAAPAGARRAAGLAAALAIVERDYIVRQRCAAQLTPELRCTRPWHGITRERESDSDGIVIGGILSKPPQHVATMPGGSVVRWEGAVE